MKKLIALAVLALLSTLLLVASGCDSDEEDPNTATGPCGITLTRPLPGEVFLSGEEVKIEWRRSGASPAVAIELLKAGDLIGTIRREEENDGWYFWTADFFEVGTDTVITGIDTSVTPPETTFTYPTLYMPNADDYSVRVRALDETNCLDTSPEFSLTNVAGCNYDFITPPAYDEEDPLILNADGSQYEITWFSTSTTGLVDLLLVHVADIVGYIARDVPDSLHSYLWSVDSLHDGTGANYKIRIEDTKVRSSCFQISPPFQIVDEVICSITVGQPVAASVFTIGEIATISWNYENVDGNLDITLSYNGSLIDVIATDVDPDQTTLAWEVWAPTPLPEENAALYRITVTDNNNLYADCSGNSDLFLITD